MMNKPARGTLGHSDVVAVDPLDPRTFPESWSIFPLRDARLSDGGVFDVTQ